MNRIIQIGMLLLAAGGLAIAAANAQTPASAPIVHLSFSPRPAEPTPSDSAPPRLPPSLESSPLTPREPRGPSDDDQVQSASYKDAKKGVSAADLDIPLPPSKEQKKATPALQGEPTSAKEIKKVSQTSESPPPLSRLPDRIEDCESCARDNKTRERWQLFSGLGARLCSTDPCYEGHWQAIADAAFYTPATRPQTQLAIRYDNIPTARLLDRGEYRWARADGLGTGPTPPAGFYTTPATRWQEATLYVEAAAPRFGLTFEVPYRSLDLEPRGHAAGFADLKTGVKSLVLDTDILQIGLQMQAYIPSGNEGKGLGVGHTSLEPALVFGVQVTPTTYFQGQVAEWIPLRGDQEYAGAILRCGTSLNQVLWHNDQACLIATGEFQSWSFQDGAYTDPYLGGGQPASGFTYLAAGPGIRLVLKQRVDFGVAAAFAINHPNAASQHYTAAFRWRF